MTAIERTKRMNGTRRQILAVLGAAVIGMSGVLVVRAADQAEQRREGQPPPPQQPTEKNTDGYKNTPMEPDGKWHVHDPDRPQPPVVTPPYHFSQGATPSSDAIVLFDGKDFSKWLNEKDGPVTTKIEDGAFTCDKENGRIHTKDEFTNFQLHIEWATPPNPSPREKGQGRGNNGVLIFRQYEIQVLDSYQNLTYADGMASAIYGQRPPLVNAAKPPGEWQTYDIIWEAPKFGEGGKVLKKPVVTVIYNGVLVQNHEQVIGHTDYRQKPSFKPPYREKGPIELYYHNNADKFRNIWIRPIEVRESESGEGEGK